MLFNFSKLGTKLLVRIPFLYTSLTNAVSVKEITHTPNPCWSGDSQVGNDIIGGIFNWMGHIEFQIESPWRGENAPYSWIEYAHSFNWMYNTRLSTSPNNRQTVNDWTVKWLNEYDTINQPIWHSDIVAKRLTNWLVHFDYYFAYTDKILKDRVLASITKHYKHLEFTEGKECDDVKKITALRGLIIGAISLNQNINIKKHIISICQTLEDELATDGFNKSANLPIQISYLKDCILVRSTLHNAEMNVPPILDNIIEKMLPAVKFFLHQDGGLAHMASWAGDNTPIQQIINRAGGKINTPNALEESGFYHIEAGKTAIIFDAHDRKNTALDNAGILSFEMSHKKQRIFVNCGYPMATDSVLFEPARGTSAHSSITIENYNAISLDKKTRLSKATSSITEAEGWQLLQGQHFGFKAICDCPIKRAITMNKSGTEIRGQDRLEQIRGIHNLESRFHLHPKINVMLLPNKTEAILKHGKTGWRFRISGGEISIEESFFIELDGTLRKTQQIVIRTKTIAQNVTLKWTMSLL